MPIESAASGADASLLFQALQLGELELANRIVMAPMTRNRAGADFVPTDIMVEYYAQRADAGLIISEGTSPSATGIAYCRQPAIETGAQIAGWKRVTEAVHARGGLIALQLMHAGRIGSHHIKPAGVETVAPSAVRAAGEVYTDTAGMQPFDTPRARPASTPSNCTPPAAICRCSSSTAARTGATTSTAAAPRRARASPSNACRRWPRRSAPAASGCA